VVPRGQVSFASREIVLAGTRFLTSADEPDQQLAPVNGAIWKDAYDIRSDFA